MNFGILVEVEEGLDWEYWRQVYTSAERLGVESVWLSDHLESPWANPRRGLETWTALAVAAAETRRLILGPLVSPVTFREPAVTARMAHTLQVLSNGRLVVGLGLGWNAEEHASAGIPFPPTAERGQRLIETIERIRCETADRQVSVLVGGKGARWTLPVVARYADEWNLTTSAASEFQSVSAQLDALCSHFERDPRDIRRSVATGILIGRDMADLHQRAERMRRCVPPLTSLEAAREMGWIVGTQDQVSAHVKLLANAGVERIIFGHYDLEDPDTLALIAESLL
jgi:alkanesulfonate monooxygenase SsuD/methylene tetrahydromethanopterin reductase-like flavin-dependent oxidoreductase (luciferase family)